MQRIERSLGKIRFNALIYLLIGIMIVCLIVMQQYYLLFFSRTLENNDMDTVHDASYQMQETVTSFLSQLDNSNREQAYNSDARIFCMSLQPWEWLTNSQSLLNSMSMVRLVNPGIDTILFSDGDLLTLGYGRDVEYRALAWFHAQTSDPVFFAQLPSVLRHGGSLFYASPSYYNATLDRQFYILTFFNTSVFRNKMQSIRENYDLSFRMVDVDGTVIFQSDDIADDVWAQLFAMVEPDGRTPSGHHLLATAQFPDAGWTLHTAMFDRPVSTAMQTLQRFSFLVTVTLIIALLLVVIALHRVITHPIRDVIRYMNAVAFHKRVEPLAVLQQNEIGELVTAMNMMLENLTRSNRDSVHAQQKLFLAEMDKKQLQLNALYNQINPHFLYNTLECIRSIAHQSGIMEIVDMTASMSKIFRYSIKSKSQVKVSDEIGCIEEYLRIIQIRHRHRFTIHIQIDEEILACRIPKMILQPIVENAVFHGLEQVRTGGTLWIRGFLTPEGLTFEVEDDGNGIQEDSLRSLLDTLRNEEVSDASAHVFEDRKSIGLININARIRMLFGSAYGIDVVSPPARGVLVRLCIPVHRASEEAPAAGER